jgi:hypothetical protein
MIIVKIPLHPPLQKGEFTRHKNYFKQPKLINLMPLYHFKSKMILRRLGGGDEAYY